MSSKYRSFWMLFFVAFSWTSQLAHAQEPASTVEPGVAIREMMQDLGAVEVLVENTWVKRWASKIAELPVVEPRTVMVGDKEVTIDESMYYSGRYGSPLAYARLFDLAAKHGYSDPSETKVFDFGYGSVGHLDMLARCGANITGIDVDPLLPNMYQDVSGTVGGGSIQLLNGRFPADEALVSDSEATYDLFISKNTLKRGYIHPSREPSNPRHIINLGVDDARFLAAVAKLLKPNGLLVIYNFCPAKAPADRPYIPWAEGECPFTTEQLTEAGFEVLVHDEVDDIAARELAQALKWDSTGGMQLESDLFAWYTIARRR